MRPIPGYSNYMAGEDGLVYRLWHYKKRLETPVPLKAYRNPMGYMQCGAIADADCPPDIAKPRRFGRPVHQLICLAFHGIPPSPKHEVDHINRQRDDNRPENLRWVTRRENTRNANMRRGCGEKHPMAKITESTAREIRERRTRGELLRVIAADVGLSIATVGRIASGHIWKEGTENGAHSHGPHVLQTP